MLKEYQISNFKAFADPQSLPIKPITLIFGPNSSGKSSILQSLLMLKQTLDEAKGDDTVLLFKGDLVDVGSYREFIHAHDVSRTFSFRVTIPKPADLAEAFPCEDYLTQVRSLDPGFVELEQSCTFDTIAISVSFSYDNAFKRTTVSRIELFIGDDSAPFMTYEPGTPGEIHEPSAHRLYNESPQSFLVLKEVNSAHEYYRANVQISFHDIATRMKEMSEDERAFGEKLFTLLGVEIPEITETEVQHPDNSIAGELWRPDKDFILLKYYLPDSLNGHDTQYIIHEDFGSPDSHNVSLFTLAVSYIFRQFLKEIQYIGPLRSYPKRDFIFSGIETQYVGKIGKYVPDLLISNKELITNLNKHFSHLGIGYELIVDTLSAQTSDLHDLFTLRFHEKSSGVHVGIADVGFGVSQVLPIIVQSLLSREKTLLIEQPELHLHPRLQAEMGDLFITSALGDAKNTLIIETHSEHLLLRIMRRMRETSNGSLPDGLPQVTPNDVCIVFVQPREGSSSAIRHLELGEEGQLLDPWPGGFFEEGYRERFS